MGRERDGNTMRVMDRWEERLMDRYTVRVMDRYTVRVMDRWEEGWIDTQ